MRSSENSLVQPNELLELSFSNPALKRSYENRQKELIELIARQTQLIVKLQNIVSNM
jgi:hypothetical protein